MKRKEEREMTETCIAFEYDKDGSLLIGDTRICTQLVQGHWHGEQVMIKKYPNYCTKCNRVYYSNKKGGPENES